MEYPTSEMDGIQKIIRSADQRTMSATYSKEPAGAEDSNKSNNDMEEDANSVGSSSSCGSRGSKMSKNSKRRGNKKGKKLRGRSRNKLTATRSSMLSSSSENDPLYIEFGITEYDHCVFIPNLRQILDQIDAGESPHLVPEEEDPVEHRYKRSEDREDDDEDDDDLDGDDTGECDDDDDEDDDETEFTMTNSRSSLYADLAFMMSRRDDCDRNELRTSEVAAEAAKQSFQATKHESTACYLQEAAVDTPYMKPPQQQQQDPNSTQHTRTTPLLRPAPPAATTSKEDHNSAQRKHETEGGETDTPQQQQQQQQKQKQQQQQQQQQQQLHRNESSSDATTKCDDNKDALPPQCVVLSACFDDPDHVTVSIQRQARSLNRGERVVMTVSNTRSRSRIPPPPLPLPPTCCNGNGNSNRRENSKDTTPPPPGAPRWLYRATAGKSTLPEDINKRNSEIWCDEGPPSLLTFSLHDDGDQEFDNSRVFQQPRNNYFGNNGIGGHSEPVSQTVKRIVSGEVLCSEDALQLTVDKFRDRTERMEEDRHFLLLKIEQLQLRVLELETSLEEERAAPRIPLPRLQKSLANLYHRLGRRSCYSRCGHNTTHTETAPVRGSNHRSNNRTTTTNTTRR